MLSTSAITELLGWNHTSSSSFTRPPFLFSAFAFMFRSLEKFKDRTDWCFEKKKKQDGTEVIKRKKIQVCNHAGS